MENEFAVHRVIDGQQEGMIAAEFDHPAGWPAQSQVLWNYGHASAPAIVMARAFDAQTLEGFEFLPAESYYWLDPNYGFEPVGQMKYGLTLLPPLPAPDALVQYAVGKYRGDRQNLRVARVAPVPQLAAQTNAAELAQIPTQGVMARVEYQENGAAYEEEFYACHYMLPPSGNQLNWGLARLFCFRARQGRLEAMRQIFWRIACSWRQNPQWAALYQNIARQLNQQHGQMAADNYARMRDEVQWGQQMSDYRNWSHDLQQGVANDRWQSDARRNEAFGDLMMGRTAFDDPQSRYGNPHHDYGQRRYAWTDGQGNWQYSDDPNFDPNLSSDRNWFRAQNR